MPSSVNGYPILTVPREPTRTMLPMRVPSAAILFHTSAAISHTSPRRADGRAAVHGRTKQEEHV